MLVCPALAFTGAHYIGPEPCSLCHQQIAKTQEQTAMATSWQGPETSWLPRLFNTSIADDLHYVIKRDSNSFQYSVDFPGEPQIALPVDILMGGRRHGLGFLLPIQQVAGIPLVRPALIQARYEWSPDKQKLLIAPGCLPSQPSSLESALGLVLSPTFESRCLGCPWSAELIGERKKRWSTLRKLSWSRFRTSQGNQSRPSRRRDYKPQTALE